MDQKEQDELISRYLKGQTNPQENLIVENLYNQLVSEQPDFQHTNDLISVRNKIYKGLPVPEGKPLVHKIWPRVAVAAAAVAAVTLGIWLYYTPRQSQLDVGNPGSAQYASDIAPGKNGATITLANGKVIQLSDAKTGVVVGDALKYSDGSDVRYSSGSRSSGSLKGPQSSTGPVGVHSLTPAELQGADGKAQQLTASTAKGQTYQFILPDGTKVWLNADSKLEFPSNFRSSKQRIVQLSGEGYFEIAKDKAHPFIVEGGGQKVEVLGTHFNINSYKDEGGLKTTLLEGSIRLTAGNKERVLRPGQQAVVDNGSVQVKEINTEQVVAWQKGYFRFYDEPIESIMRKVARWYNVEVVYSGPVPSEGFNARITRYSTIKEVLEILESTKAVHFKVEGRRVIVSKFDY